MSEAEPPKPGRSATGAVLVAAGIFLSRVAGLVRQKAMAHYLGSSEAADAFNAAFRIPNLLQNLFGEGALSASFIPVYSQLLARGKSEEADRLASGVGTLLALVTAVLVALGVTLTPWLVDLLAIGFEGDKRELTVQLVRVLFPGTGLLVLSAWCLGVLNSHRRFLLSYAAPVMWNAAMVAALLFFGPHSGPDGLAVILAWASVAGSFLQFAVQIPAVLAVARGVRPQLDLADPHLREVVTGFGPAFVGRGVMQISSYIDSDLASLLPDGSVAVFAYAQVLYTLPVSLFGMSVSAAELTAMSSTTGSESEVAVALQRRLEGSLARVAFLVVPSSAAFLAIGDVIAAGLFQGGAFHHDDAMRVWLTLAGSSVGMLAQTWGRLYSSTWYALKDTRTPLRFAVVRVILTTVLGYLMAVQLPGLVGVDASWGLGGLTASAGLAGWVEYTLLKRSLDARIGPTGLSAWRVARLWLAAAAGALAAWAVKLAIAPFGVHPILAAIAICGAFGVTYGLGTAALGVEEARAILRRLRIVK